MPWNFWRFPKLRFFCPDAEAVWLRVEGVAEPVPMRASRSGEFVVRAPEPRSELLGRSYGFEVSREGKRKFVADPRASWAAREGEVLVSRFGCLDYRFRKRRFRGPATRDLVIYETHLPALSRHPSTSVADESHRGTYVGARSPAVLDHLERLGVAVELLPLHASDHLLGQDWGYFSTSFRAITSRYAVAPDETNRELMALIDALHLCGVPVILDVVFNHGAAMLAKAWGEDVVYRREPHSEHFCHGSGCGPTVASEHPRVREEIISALRHLVRDYRIDGFRFDLGALHDVDTVRAIARRLPRRIHLFAEPWALGGAKWGKGEMCTVLADTRWAVWNDDFREPARAFVCGSGSSDNRDRLMRAITGSHVDDGGFTVRPSQSVNYLSSHDGQTLADLVAGDEGRVFLAMILLLTAQGIPMISEGTELLHGKGGHENSYDRPDLNQLDWSLADAHAQLVDAIAALVRMRRSLPHFGYRGQLRRRNGPGEGWDIDWIFPSGFPHADNPNALGYRLRPPRRRFPRTGRGAELIVLLNGSHSGAKFELPDGAWRVVVDSHARRVALDVAGDDEPARGDYYLNAGTGAVLLRL